MGKYRKQFMILFYTFVAIFVGIVAHDYIILSKQPIWADEYVFLKITDNLPSYSSSKEWLNGFNLNLNDKFYDIAYETKVWGHPPTANIIMYLPAKLIGNFIEKIWAYRLLYAIFIVGIVGLLIDVIRRKFGWAVASMSLVPVILSQYLLAAGIYVYYDTPMCLLLALTIWIMEVMPNSKWKYVTTIAMVLSKIYAVAFIIPLALLYRKDLYKILSCSLALIPFIIYQWIATGQPLYIFTRWALGNQWNWETFRVIVWPNIWTFVIDWGLYIHVPLVIGGIIAYTKNKSIHYSYIILYLIIVALAINGGLMGNKTYPIIFGAMFVVIPLAKQILAKIEKMELADASNI